MPYNKIIILLALIGIYCSGMFLIMESNEMDPGNEFKEEVQFEPIALIELFTSEGCSSCPPADRLLTDIINRSETTEENIFALSFHVDYWDRLGWKDKFSSPVFSQRQKDYARALKTNRLYTPQMILNGKYEFVGSDKRDAANFIEKGLSEPSLISISVFDLQVDESGYLDLNYSVSNFRNDLSINFAVIESNITRFIKSGENKGRRLFHSNTVRAFNSDPLINQNGMGMIKLPKDLKRENASIIVYVQDSITMEVYGAIQKPINSSVQQTTVSHQR